MKSYLQSKRFWFNALTVVLAVASYYGFSPDPQVTNGVANTLVVASPIVNLLLTMFASKTGIALSLPSTVNPVINP